MFKIISGFLGWILSPILSILNLLPPLPAELLSVMTQAISYIDAGMNIFNFFCPVAAIAPAVGMFLSVYTIKHGYDFVMWVLRKIPFLSVD